MQLDFHYYATYCAAILAGYSHEESSRICYCAQFVDNCTRTYLGSLKAPVSAASTQTAMEMADARTDQVGLQDITRIWSSFHFLPYDLNAEVPKKCGKSYQNKYRLICNSNGALVADTVNLAKNKSLPAVGVAMHVLADTWAHRYFAGTPSLVINNTNYHFYEIIKEENGEMRERKVKFGLKAGGDDLENGVYISSISSNNENSIFNLGHGRAGHLPDYSFMRYRYMPAWGNYNEIYKENPSDYYHAFCQMVYAMKYLRGEYETFELERYDTETVAPYEARIKEILEVRRLDSSVDWKALGEELSGCEIEDFDVDKYREEYMNAGEDEKNQTLLGEFILATMSQKSMVTNKIYSTGSRLAGYSVNYEESGFKGIKDFETLVKNVIKGEEKND